MASAVVKLTKKGQATIPKAFRDKFGFTDRALLVEAEEGVLLKPLPAIADERGSLREWFRGVSAKDLLDAARGADRTRERELEQR
jgi:AbrB family looped-hinge helix DNA binding protein